MKYKVVRFRQTDQPENELDSLIVSLEPDGWEYVNHEYSTKLIPGSAGCFGFGAKPNSTQHVGFVIFKKPN